MHTTSRTSRVAYSKFWHAVRSHIGPWGASRTDLGGPSFGFGLLGIAERDARQELAKSLAFAAPGMDGLDAPLMAPLQGVFLPVFAEILDKIDGPEPAGERCHSLARAADHVDLFALFQAVAPWQAASAARLASRPLEGRDLAEQT